TGGSADNLERLRRGYADLALVQSDWQYIAAPGGGAGDTEPWDGLRAVYSTYALAVTVLARAEAGISVLGDLKHRRVNLGKPGSGARAVAEGLMGALGWQPGDFEAIAELGVDETIRALCDARIDAAILPVSHPSGAVAAATEGCGARLVEVTGPAVATLIETWPFYALARIPGGLYGGVDAPVETYGVRATLVAGRATADNAVYQVVKATFENLEALTAQHPVLAGLRRKDMIRAAITAPFHEGAARYFREVGLQ
ncbi:MAG: TAXI family TRAP transporter solute-binding subunit, partial [Kiloniellaceae bacterium]